MRPEFISPQAARLGTRRLILRAQQMSDAPAITACLQDWDVTKTLARVPFPYRLTDAREWLKGEQERRAAGEAYAFAITRRDDPAGFCIGVCALGQREDGEMNLGFWLGRPFWGQGLMTEAVSSVLRFGFVGLGLARIHSGYFRGNEASRRVHEKMGFAVTGEGPMFCRAQGAELPHIDLALPWHGWRGPAKPVELVT